MAPSDAVDVSSNKNHYYGEKHLTHENDIEGEYTNSHLAEHDSQKAKSNYSSDGSNESIPRSLDPATEKDLEAQQDGDLTKGHADEQTEPVDPNIVDWDGPDDPSNPQNWTAAQKWVQIGIVSALSILTPMASSGFAPGVPQLMKDFNSDSKTMATFVVSIYIIGFACGPLVVAPLSELYGRLWVYHLSNIAFIGFTIACSRANGLGEMLAFRFFEGVFGVTPITIGGGTIADLMPAEQRGAATAVWGLGPLVGPVAGPVIGGFLSSAKGWRWMFYLIAIVGGAFVVPALFFLKETYPPVLLEQKAARLRKETGNQDLRSAQDQQQTPREMFRLAAVRPMKLIFLSPICGLMCVYMALVYGLLYLLFTTFTYVFEGQYGMSSSTVGLVYLGLGIGNIIGLAALGKSSDAMIVVLGKRYGTGNKPEYRLPPLILASPLMGIGFFIYGFTVKYNVQWAVPIFGTLLIGIGMIIAFMVIITYLVDSFGQYSASAVAANTVFRSIIGGVFPLFALQMYKAMGLDWGNAMLGFLSLALAPIPWFFWVYGEKIRTNPKWQVKL